MVVEKTLESPLDCKEIQPVHSKGDQPWVFTGGTDAEAQIPILWAPHVKSWLTGKDPDAGRDWGQEEKGTTEDEMAGRHHRLDGHEFGWTPGVGDGQGGLLCCHSWGCKKSDMTERLNWTDGTGCHDLSFWLLSFKPAFPLSFFTLKKLFSSSSLSATRMVSSTYLWLLIFLLEILIPACESSSPAFCTMYSALCFYFMDSAKAFDCVDHNKLWKNLKEAGSSSQFTCLLRNLYAGQEATGKTRHGTTDWFKI